MTQTAKALLVCRGGEPEIVVELAEPPPQTYYLPTLRPLTLDEPSRASSTTLQRRSFRLDLTFRSPNHKWMRVYNEGRSQTPEDAYVYFENQ